MKNEHGERFYHIDFLKGICIIFVIITHYNWEDTERLKLLFPFYIDMAVPVFMIISGYMYAVSYKKNNINSIGDAYLAKNITNKILRFTIPFSIIFIIEQIIYFLQNGQQYSRSVLDFIHLFLIGGTGPGSICTNLLVKKKKLCHNKSQGVIYYGYKYRRINKTFTRRIPAGML